MKKIINNFDLIAPILTFSDNLVYEVSIINRNKRDEGMGNTLVKSYIIDSLDKFYKSKVEMMNIASVTNSEVIIIPQPYNLHDLWFSIMNNLLNQKRQGIFNLQSLSSDAIGNCISSIDRWVIDIDFLKLNSTLDLEKIKDVILNKCGSRIVLEIPGINKVQLLIDHFNIHQFITYQDVYYKCDIIKNNSILLYYEA